MIDLKNSVKAAFCGLASAICVALMFAGSLFYVFAYAIPMLLSLVTFMVNKTFGKGFSLYVYGATALISLFFVPEKETVMMYVLFFGYYPIVKPYIEKIRIKFIPSVIKFLFFNIAVLVIEIICVYVFGIPFFEDDVFSKSMLIFFTIAMNLSFVMYEFLLKSFAVLYEKKIESRIKNALK